MERNFNERCVEEIYGPGSATGIRILKHPIINRNPNPDGKLQRSESVA